MFFKKYINDMRFVAFPATEYDEVLLGYQPGHDPADSPRELHI